MGQKTGQETCLVDRACVPCKGGEPPLAGEALEKLKNQLGGEWNVVDGHHLERQFKFDNFKQALEFTNKVGELAERVGHHPDIHLGWGKVKLTVWTHKIGGLSEADFVFAAKVNQLKS